MVMELHPDEFASVLPLLPQSRSAFPLIRAVVQNQQPGRILVDTGDPAKKPSSAMIITRFGFACMAGDGNNLAFNHAVAEWINHEASNPASYILWYDPPVMWRKQFDAMPEQIRMRQRCRLEYRSPSFGPLPALPDGFRLLSLDAELLPAASHFKLDLASRFWPSAAALLQQGAGVCLMRDEVMASICYAACVADGEAEIDIATAPEYRQMGLGFFVARKFVDVCAARGLAPTWDCFDNNTGSRRLARKLGFVEKFSYPLYTFNTPVQMSFKDE